jgi:hypothetical protein
MSNLDELRFKAAFNSGTAYCQSFIKYGRKRTTAVCKGTIESSAGALMQLEGEAAAYNFLQRLADEIAKSMIERREL